MLMDMGLSPTLGRQVANARGKKADFNSLRRLLRSFELIFIFLAILIAFVIILSSNWLATNWIKSENLSRETIVYCIFLMSVMIGVRWFSGLYRSGINGFEDQVWLNQTNTIFASFRYLGSLLFLAYFSVDIRHFFEFQLFISIFEPLVLGKRFYRNLPRVSQNPGLISFDWSEIKAVMPFALGVSYSAGIWILVTQTDRLILSGILSLKEFGYLTLVTLVSSGIMVLAQPIGAAVRPRMTLLLAEKRKSDFISLYRKSSKFVALISFSLAIFVGLNAELIIYSLSGNREAADWGGKVLIWFAFGNAFLAIGAFQFYLQTAFGDLSLHVRGDTIKAALQFPAIVYMATNYGVVGAGITWCVLRVTFFLVWTPIVHRKFLPGFHCSWLFRDILPIVVFSLLVGISLSYFFALSNEACRWLLFFKLAVLGSLQLLVTLFGLLLFLKWIPSLQIILGSKA
jgi:O-antigen/teichoic acid export membrane protein